MSGPISSLIVGSKLNLSALSELLSFVVEYSVFPVSVKANLNLVTKGSTSTAAFRAAFPSVNDESTFVDLLKATIEDLKSRGNIEEIKKYPTLVDSVVRLGPILALNRNIPDLQDKLKFLDPLIGPDTTMANVIAEITKKNDLLAKETGASSEELEQVKIDSKKKIGEITAKFLLLKTNVAGMFDAILEAKNLNLDNLRELVKKMKTKKALEFYHDEAKFVNGKKVGWNVFFKK